MKLWCKVRFRDKDRICEDTATHGTKEEAIDWINRKIGMFGPLNIFNEDKIQALSPGEKKKFKIMDTEMIKLTVSISCRK